MSRRPGPDGGVPDDDAAPARPDTPVLVIDGSRFTDFEGFAAEFSRLLAGVSWAGNLDAFDDILGGGFGTPDGGFVLRWEHAESSRRALGHTATAAWLRSMLRTCHPSNRAEVAARLADAGEGRGPTLFDEVVEIIRGHGPGGHRAESGVELELS